MKSDRMINNDHVVTPVRRALTDALDPDARGKRTVRITLVEHLFG